MLLKNPAKGGPRSKLYQQMQLERLREMEASLHSGIFLEVTLFTRTPVKKGQYPLNFRAEYGPH
jgi:hypothetical protein